MTLRHLKIFLVVCEQDSITKAAEKLYISQPAVSNSVKELEDYYGIKLFDRISKRLILTEAGKRVLEYATHIVSLFDEMESNIHDLDKMGKLNIGSSMTIGTNFMPNFVRRFKDLFPQTDIRVIIDSSDVIEKKIQRGELDFGLIESVVHLESIISETFMDDELAIICNPTHPFCNKTVNIKDFIGEPFLLREKGSGARELFDDVLTSQGFSITPIWESTNTQALVNAAANGLGISVLPYILIKEELVCGKIGSFKVDGLKFKRKFNIIYHKNKYLTSTAKAFIDMCKNS